MLDIADIQGVLLRGYSEKKHACFVLAAIDDARECKRWLAGVEVTGSKDVRLGLEPTPAELARRDIRYSERSALNIALTHRGLRALGLTDDRARAFSLPFRSGMASERARRILCDRHWEDWDWSDAAVDMLVMVYAPGDGELRRARESVLGELAAFATTEVLPTRDLGGIEHFGFRDGIAQPRLLPREGERGVAPGEIVLGYPDERGGGATDGSDLRYNGSYLVMRQIYQDVAAFWRYMKQAACPVSDPRTDPSVYMAAKMVGRWPGGEPIVRHPDADPGPREFPSDDFGFRSSDPEGDRCPLGSHIRRMNPRDWLFGTDEASARRVTDRHRVLRRGRPYGEPVGLDAVDMARNPDRIEDADRGLHFVCFNADILRQFEFLQQTWGNNAKFAGLSADPDPIVGQLYQEPIPDPQRPHRRCFTVQQDPVRHRALDVPDLVQLRGGGYFFLPGIRALRAIAAL
jgi:Dyp-type peroxidase family